MDGGRAQVRATVLSSQPLVFLDGPGTVCYLPLFRRERVGTHTKAVGFISTLVLLLLAGCGPVEYINQVTRRASSEVAAARAVDAEKYAPYEFTLAVEYLHKAREEAGYADYQAAIRFGESAEKKARDARRIALSLAGTEPTNPGEAPIDPSSLPASSGDAP
jgi:hypothetical protein